MPGVAQADKASMKEIQIRRFGAWQIATAIGEIDAKCGTLFAVSGNFCGWAKMGPITGSSPIDEPGEHVWFEFGKTREEATWKLCLELGIIYVAPSEAPEVLESIQPPSQFQPPPPPQKA